ncbi:hypothetical protein [Rahnella laticis]|uniref:hypothetical protein n=1 Tax=Rahnella laticis TaxID=2787622 RepID=UPI0018A32902|nr:hypothetical protein [Rahnella laticis]MBF7993933.1 hypothetical protein [Rahnella laticis]
MNKFTKGVIATFSGMFLAVFLIEGGMRFAVWMSLNDLVPSGVEYNFEMSELENSLKFGCTSTSRKDYMNVFYVHWIYSIMESKIICRHQSPYMSLTVFGTEVTTGYHWSFYSLGLINNVD